MSEQDTSTTTEHPRQDDRNVEIDQSPVPDPTDKEPGAADDPEAD